jgi:hypothetical protein
MTATCEMSVRRPRQFCSTACVWAVSSRRQPGAGRALPGAVQVSRIALLPGSSVFPAPVIAPCASDRCGTASPHPSAGTGAGRPRREPPAAARAAPTTPPRPKSPGTTTPPACGSSGPHVHSQAGQAPAPSSCSSGSPAGRNELTPGQRRSSCLAAPGQRPGAIANPPDACCTKNVAATCRPKHPSADRY